MDNLDQLFASDQRRRSRSRCVKCGSAAPVRIQLVICRVGQGGKPKQGQQTAKSVRVCGDCAVALLGGIDKVWPI